MSKQLWQQGEQQTPNWHWVNRALVASPSLVFQSMPCMHKCHSTECISYALSDLCWSQFVLMLCTFSNLASLIQFFNRLHELSAAAVHRKPHIASDLCCLLLTPFSYHLWEGGGVKKHSNQRPHWPTSTIIKYEGQYNTQHMQLLSVGRWADSLCLSRGGTVQSWTT